MKQLAKIVVIVVFLGVSWCGCLGAEGEYSFMGDFEGRWDRGSGVYPPAIAAQIVPWKDDGYLIHLFTALRKKAPEYVVIEAKTADIRFMRKATLPTGKRVKAFPKSMYKGDPGGCTMPSE